MIRSLQPAPTPTAWTPPPPAEVAHPQDLPEIGKWMYAHDGQPADWLGLKVQGKTMREPINLVVVDAHAKSADDARERLEDAFHQAGYKQRHGHSGGYRAWVDGAYQEQLPRTFSNDEFLVSNNHGRVFGPVEHDGAYVFVGAFSREHVDPVGKPGTEHRFESFNIARDDVADRLNLGAYRIAGDIPLGNAIPADPTLQTGDHDGNATLLMAR